jgi:hypothetical protein
MGNINTNDIESISALKDGASSSIYGTRACKWCGIDQQKEVLKMRHLSSPLIPILAFKLPRTEIDLLTSDQWIKP